MTTLKKLIAAAEKAHRKFPQYKGHWDDWILVKITQQVKTRLGVAFEEGELTIAAPQPSPPFASGGVVFRTVYSASNKTDTVVEVAVVQVVKPRHRHTWELLGISDGLCRRHCCGCNTTQKLVTATRWEVTTTAKFGLTTDHKHCVTDGRVSTRSPVRYQFTNPGL